MITQQQRVKRTRSQNRGLTSLASTLLVPGRPSGPPYLHSVYEQMETIEAEVQAATTALKLTEDRFEGDDNADDSDYDSDFDFEF